ncbi:hypothetical protein [Singulisphaera sp. PoT]|uniref:hypothetical protein n=1 Tax=Singulisphaera sp. PoT TaxID=3411797 RepID=UPI003BF60FAF
MRRLDARLVTLRSILTIGLALTPMAMLPAADEKPVAPAPNQESPKPKGGEKLRPKTEERLRWGKPVNGLRSSIVIRPSSDVSKSVDVPELFLVVQNVSEAPIHFSDATESPKLRELSLKNRGRTQLVINDKKPTFADVVLQPREVVVLPMISTETKNPDGRTAGSIIAEGVLKETQQTLVGTLTIESAKQGAWTGKLISGETSGEAAQDKP